MVKIVSTNPINQNRVVGYAKGIEVKFNSDLTAEVSEEDAEFLITIDNTLSIVGDKTKAKKEADKTAESGSLVEDEFEDYVVTEEDMAEDPTLFERGIKAGDVIKKKKELTEAQLRERLDEKSKKVLVEEFGEELGLTLAMKKEEMIEKIIVEMIKK